MVQTMLTFRMWFFFLFTLCLCRMATQTWGMNSVSCETYPWIINPWWTIYLPVYILFAYYVMSLGEISWQRHISIGQMIKEGKERHVESTKPKQAFVLVSKEPLPVMIMPLLKTEVAALSITAPEGLYLSIHTSMSRTSVCVCVCIRTCI